MKSSSRPWQVKKVNSGDFPWNVAVHLDFSSQILMPQKDGRNRLFIRAECSKCAQLYYRRVSDLKYLVKQGIPVVWLCGDCRKDMRWNDGGYTMTYRPEHPNARKGGVLPEHTLVMTEVLGRPLTKDENVHHKNGVRHDNRPENLELWSVGQPAGQRIEDKVRWAIELKDQYPLVWKRVRAQMLKESKNGI